MQPGRDPKGRSTQPIRTPRGELEKLRQAQDEDDAEIRTLIMDSMLDVCGEVGYRRMTVETVYRRYGGHRPHFYRHFKSKADCFIAAYNRECERLLARLTRVERDRLEADQLQEALEQLGGFVAERPLRARALFVEVHVAGGDALGKRREVFERLSLALDKAGRETMSRHSVPPLTGEFIINVVDQAVSSALIKGDAEEFARAVPELTSLICEAYGR